MTPIDDSVHLQRGVVTNATFITIFDTGSFDCEKVYVSNIEYRFKLSCDEPCHI